MLLWLCIAVRVVANPCSNALQKLLATRGAPSLALVTLTQAGLAILAAPWLVTRPLPSSAGFWIYSVMSAGLAVAGNGLIIEAVRRSDLSVLGPINSYKPVVSLIPGVLLLGERPGWAGLTGIGLVVLGSLLLAGSTGESQRGFAGLVRDRGVQLRFAALMLSACEAVFLKRVVLASSPSIAFAWWAVLGLVIVAPVGLRPLGRAFRPGGVGTQGANPGWLALLIVTTGLMQFCSLVAFQQMPVGVALALFQMSTLLSVVLGWAVFRELHFRRRLAGAGVMAVGAAVLILRSQP